MWAKAGKNLVGLGLLAFCLNSFALPILPIATKCLAGPYHPPAAVQKINYMGQNKPICKDEFLSNLKATSMDASCKEVLKKMLAFAENHVRPIACDDGKIGNAVFLTKKVFIGNAHRFFDPINGTVKKSQSEIGKCYVSKFDKNRGMYVKNFVDARAPIKIGDPSDTGGDHAVGSLTETLDDVEPVDADKKILNRAYEGDELWIMSAVNSFTGTNHECFAVGSCHAQTPLFTPDGDFSSVYSTDCPGEPGTSGSPVFAMKKDSAGKCLDFGIVALQSGEDTRLPNGSKYHYPESANDPQAMWASEVGIDNKFRQNITEVLQDSQRREYSESQPVQSKVPAGQDL